MQKMPVCAWFTNLPFLMLPVLLVQVPWPPSQLTNLESRDKMIKISFTLSGMIRTEVVIRSMVIIIISTHKVLLISLILIMLILIIHKVVMLFPLFFKILRSS